jgi:hypothetical protein
VSEPSAAPGAAAERRRALYALLGALPPRERPVSAELVLEERHESYTVERLVLDLNGREPVPALFTRPLDAAGPLPVVLYHHAHGGDYVLGKTELITGRSALHQPPYAEALARLGIAALAIDHWNFGERRGRTESALFKELLWHGQVLWGVMVYDALKAIDYLLTRPDVDPHRIATLGISMGSTMAWWQAALDERVAVCVDLCCLSDFQALLETRAFDQHNLYYYVPGLLQHFSSAQINALICPRPHLSLAGLFDPLTPPSGLDRIDTALRATYAAAGAADRWHLVRSPSGHFETAAMRHHALAFLSHWLGRP